MCGWVMVRGWRGWRKRCGGGGGREGLAQLEEEVCVCGGGEELARLEEVGGGAGQQVCVGGRGRAFTVGGGGGGPAGAGGWGGGFPIHMYPLVVTKM